MRIEGTDVTEKVRELAALGDGDPRGERARTLLAPIPDYEAAAREAGWFPNPNSDNGWVWKDPNGHTCAPSWQEACESDGLDVQMVEPVTILAIGDELAEALESGAVSPVDLDATARSEDWAPSDGSRLYRHDPPIYWSDEPDEELTYDTAEECVRLQRIAPILRDLPLVIDDGLMMTTLWARMPGDYAEIPEHMRRRAEPTSALPSP